MAKSRARAERQPTSVGPNVPFPIVGVGASAGGSKRSRNCSRSFRPTREWRSCSSSISTRRIPASSPMPSPRRRRCRSRRPRTASASSPTTSTSSLRTPTSHSVRRSLTLLPTEDRSAQAAPAHRLLPSRPSRRSAATRRSASILSGTASDGTEGLRAIKARRRHHLRAGPEVGEVRWHAAQRDRRRRRRLRPAIPELARELVRLSRHPYVVGGVLTAIRQRRPHRSTRSSRSCGTRVGVDFSEYKAPIASSGGSRAGWRCARIERLRELPRSCSSDDPEEVRASVRGHPHPRHLVLPGSGRLREPEGRRSFRRS